MVKNYYIRFAFEPKAVKVSRAVFNFAIGLADTYDCFISLTSHPRGFTLTVGFSYFFFNSELYYELL